MDVAALDKALQNGLSWPATILCPNADRSGEYNLLRQTPQPFRKSKCVGKGVDLSIWKTKVEIRIHEPIRGFQDKKNIF